MTTKLGDPTIKTDRLNIWAVSVVPSEINAERTVFLGFRTDMDYPSAVVVATLWVNYPGGADHFVEWVETNSIMRREGLAKELLMAIKGYLGGELSMEGATDEGVAFVDAWDKSAEKATQ